mgnify:FL=1|tara:strand:+ start:556 stop:975 length:420 start_codon:yes stop_codon:yes gene_type:complete
MKIEISNGDLIDKITILEIKIQEVSDKEKRKNIIKEYELLVEHEFKCSHKDRLKDINYAIWGYQDMIRKLLRKNVLNNTFMNYAKRVHELGEERSILKRQIDTETRSNIIEEKGYETPEPTPCHSYSSLDDPVFFMEGH